MGYFYYPSGKKENYNKKNTSVINIQGFRFCVIFCAQSSFELGIVGKVIPLQKPTRQPTEIARYCL